jgi:hypothetical protein
MPGRRVVGAAARIEAARFQQFHLAFLRPRERGRTEHPAVVVHAAALELARLTVELEPVHSIHRNGAEPEPGGLFVKTPGVRPRNGVRPHHCSAQRIQRGLFRRPRQDVPHAEGRGDHGGRAGGQIDLCLTLPDNGAQYGILAIRAAGALSGADFPHLEPNPRIYGFRPVIADREARLHLGLLRPQLRRGDLQGPGFNPHGIPNQQPHRPIQARTGIPAGVREPAIVDFDANQVFPRHQPGGEITMERAVPIGSPAGDMPVHQHHRVHVGALHLEHHGFARFRFRQFQLLFIPANRTRVESIAASAHRVCRTGQGNTGVVRQIHLGPGLVGLGARTAGPVLKTPCLAEILITHLSSSSC